MAPVSQKSQAFQQSSRRWNESRSSILDVDRAESAFALLFSFVHDSQCEEEDDTFDTVLREMLRGLSVPTGAKEKLERIYASVQRAPRELPVLLADVVRDFGDQHEILVSLVRLMLRLSADEGLLSRRHIADLRETLRVFAVPLDAFDVCDSDEKQLLSFVLTGSRDGVEAFGCVARELRQHYDTLGVDADATDEELRRAYRRLAKRYHPDTVYSEGSQRVRERARRFQAVQHAYEMVRRSRFDE